MKLTRKKADFLKESVTSWMERSLLGTEEGKRLIDDIEVVPFDWKRLAKYSFWVSLICIVSAVSAALADRALVEFLRRIFNAPYLAKCLALTVAASALYGWGFARKRKYPAKGYSNEAVLFLGVLATAGAVYQLGRAFDTGSGHFSVLLLLSCFLYGILGFYFRSTLIWVFALLSLGSWMGAETGYQSGWGSYYLGMNYPLRFVLFGAVLTAAAYLFGEKADDRFRFFARSTQVVGLLYLFVALWILSIFGNYDSMTAWESVRQIELFHWSLLFGLAAAGAVYYGLKRDDKTAKSFGLTFLLINLYTRFFEFFWDGLHKAVFFALLAASFWILGLKAEKIWAIGQKKDPEAFS